MYKLPYIATEECLFYLRKSRTDDPSLTTEETLEKHEQMLDDWVARNIRDRDGNPVTGRVPEENRFREIVSGETIDSRPEVQAMLRKAESPKYKALIVVEPQRLSRGDLEDIGKLVKLLRYSKTIVCTLTYNYDLNDPHDRDSFERELKRGNEFLEYQKRIMWNGRLSAIENGCYIGNIPPYGYDKDTIKRGKRTLHTLKENAAEAEVVRDIFRWYAEEGLGAQRISDRLNAMGVKPRKCRSWHPDAIPPILANEHYLGRVVWNKRPRVRSVKSGEVVTRRPVAPEYIVRDGLHEAIISRELWDAVQERRGKIPRHNKSAELTNHLAGLIYCQCGRAMIRKTGKSQRPRLLCRYQTNCGTASCLVEEMDAKLVEVLREAIADFEVRVSSGEDDNAEKHRAMVERLQTRLEELYDLEATQWDKHNRGEMPKRVFDRLNEKTAQEIEEAQQALREAQDSLPEPVDLHDRVFTFRAALDALLDPDAPAPEKNDLLKACIERVAYSRERSGSGKLTAPMVLDVCLRV